MEPDDSQLDALRQQIRAELGTAPDEQGKKRRKVLGIIYITCCVITPLVAAAAVIWKSHHFGDLAALFHWLWGCLAGTCAS